MNDPKNAPIPKNNSRCVSEGNKIRGFFEIRGYWKYLEFVTTLQQKRACVLDSKPFCVLGKYEECRGGI